jgi:hypothetical protein
MQAYRPAVAFSYLTRANLDEHCYGPGAKDRLRFASKDQTKQSQQNE